MTRFVATVLPRAPFYAGLSDRSFGELPIVDKAHVMGDFAAFNTRGIERERALELALAAERSRDFRPALGDVTVGLSSGTSGNRGLFLVSDSERRNWAGIVLARVLTDALLARVLAPWRAPLRVAFFFRSDSNLYRTIASARIDFAYYDLERPFAELVAALGAAPPDVLVAPASALRLLARARASGALGVAPEKIVAVAEVLDDDDAAAIEAAFGTPVDQMYQCTEGFLAYTCALHRLHLNERYVRIETEWLDAERTRFVPIVTDFTRTTQIFARYRLDDVLRVAPACACGCPERAIGAIEGRADDILWLAGERSAAVPVFPDFVRRAMALAGECVRDYRLDVALESDAPAIARARAGAELDALWQRLRVRPPHVRFVPWQPEPLARKRRRVTGARDAFVLR